MIKLLTGAEMAELDRAASEEYGLAGVVLMSHAGVAVAHAARDMLGDGASHVCVVCGKGNNGGDGFVAARWLQRFGIVPEVFLVGARDEVQGDAKVNLELLERTGGSVEVLVDEADFVLLAGSLRRCALVVDALLGTGLAGAPRQTVGTAIRLINQAKRPVLAVDVPSGLNSDSGELYDPHVRADRTVTFAAWKRGLVLYPGAQAAGQVELADIGLPSALIEALDRAPELVEAADVATLLPPRGPEWHKGTAGRVLLVAGSRSLSGAALLAARAAARGGAGLVTLASTESVLAALRVGTPEIMTLTLPEDEAGAMAVGAFEKMEAALAAAQAVAIGPGLGTGEGAQHLFAQVVRGCQKPLVIDADGLNLLAQTPEVVEGLTIPLLLTPHPGEAARLLKADVKRVEADRLGAAAALSRRFSAITVLKGAHTVIAPPLGRAVINPTGGPAMASGGMGDALTGLLAALLAQGLAPADAAVAGVWLHGRAAELAAGGSDAGLLAGDLIAALPAARAELRR
jgi:NAD(P)H-hydrate epimerase